MVRSKLTKEGEYLPADMADMTLTIDQQQKVIFFLFGRSIFTPQKCDPLFLFTIHMDPIRTNSLRTQNWSGPEA